MIANKITDLTILGAVKQGATTADQITSLAKSLTPELWLPVTSVIETAIRRNLKLKYLRCKGPGTSHECLSLTHRGVKRLMSLLRDHTGLDLSPVTLAYEKIQYGFLDTKA